MRNYTRIVMFAAVSADDGSGPAEPPVDWTRVGLSSVIITQVEDTVIVSHCLPHEEADMEAITFNSEDEAEFNFVMVMEMEHKDPTLVPMATFGTEPDAAKFTRGFLRFLSDMDVDVEPSTHPRVSPGLGSEILNVPTVSMGDDDAPIGGYL